LQFDRAHIEGISSLQAKDIRYAEQLGYRIKLLGITKQHANGVELRVHPTLISSKKLIANVEGAMNAVWVKGDAVGHTMYYGKGAGAEPTASAVIADLVDVARTLAIDSGHRVPDLGFQSAEIVMRSVVPIDEALADGGISIDAFFQREPDEGADETDVVLIAHRCIEKKMRDAIRKIEALKTVLSEVVVLRLESFS
jgi:homoserine dehydrogenase